MARTGQGPRRFARDCRAVASRRRRRHESASPNRGWWRPRRRPGCSRRRRRRVRGSARRSRSLRAPGGGAGLAQFLGEPRQRDEILDAFGWRTRQTLADQRAVDAGLVRLDDGIARNGFGHPAISIAIGDRATPWRKSFPALGGARGPRHFSTTLARWHLGVVKSEAR